MNIRRAGKKDLDGINNLLRQVLEVHHSGRPDIFKGNAKKYTDDELVEITKDPFLLPRTMAKSRGMLFVFSSSISKTTF